MEKLLNEEVIQQIGEVFAELVEPVAILFFKKNEDCEYCDTTQQLVEEVAAISEKISVKTYDLETDADVAQQYNIDKVPGLAIAAQDGDTITDYGVHFAGVPSGHEFTSLIHDIINVSRRGTHLNDATREFLKNLKNPVHLQVFVTPTCPYCPQAVVLAHQMAIESELVTAEMVEATEFPELSQRFGVSGVPQTTINAGAGTVVGALPEDELVAAIEQALEQ